LTGAEELEAVTGAGTVDADRRVRVLLRIELRGERRDRLDGRRARDGDIAVALRAGNSGEHPAEREDANRGRGREQTSVGADQCSSSCVVSHDGAHGTDLTWRGTSARVNAG